MRKYLLISILGLTYSSAVAQSSIGLNLGYSRMYSSEIDRYVQLLNAANSPVSKTNVGLLRSGWEIGGSWKKYLSGKLFGVVNVNWSRYSSFGELQTEEIGAVANVMSVHMGIDYYGFGYGEKGYPYVGATIGAGFVDPSLVVNSVESDWSNADVILQLGVHYGYRIYLSERLALDPIIYYSIAPSSASEKFQAEYIGGTIFPDDDSTLHQFGIRILTSLRF